MFTAGNEITLTAEHFYSPGGQGQSTPVSYLLTQELARAALDF